LKSGAGWSPLQEAICSGRPENVGIIYTFVNKKLQQDYFKKIPDLLNAMRKVMLSLRELFLFSCSADFLFFFFFVLDCNSDFFASILAARLLHGTEMGVQKLGSAGFEALFSFFF
jgi:hypothetical protein